jgi:cob(I)alamin adenosyltransferase
VAAVKLKQGLVQIYTGDGKGKTTAALGLAARASGAGLKVHIQQFIKGLPYSEHKTLRCMKNVTYKQCGRGCFIKRNPCAQDKRRVIRGMAEAQNKLLSGACDVLVLDEINVAMKMGLIPAAKVIALIKAKPRSAEIVLTGRGCPRKLYKHADLVTEMKEVKHPYRLGVSARRGIEC